MSIGKSHFVITSAGASVWMITNCWEWKNAFFCSLITLGF